jgi:hypothetical protein
LIFNSNSLDNDSQLMLSNKSRLETTTGMYFASIHGKIHQSLLKSETSINCVLSIPGTNYTRRKEAIYYGESLIQNHLKQFVPNLLQNLNDNT